MLSLVQAWLLDPLAIICVTGLCLIVFLLLQLNRFVKGYKRFVYLGLCFGWVCIVLMFTAPRFVHPLLLTLEGQYLHHPECAYGSHIVMLGGGVNSRADSEYDYAEMSSSTIARAGVAASLAFEQPHTRIIASGGALRHVAEADVIANFWQLKGIEPQRIIRETTSRSTRENALEAARILAGENVHGPVKLVTSALHMPRALATFKRPLAELGLELCPVIAQPNAVKNIPNWAVMPQTTALVKFDQWLHEMIALGIYRWRGWL